MSLGNFLIMRQELLMVAVVLIVLMAEIFTSHENRKHISTFTVILFAVVTIVGFFPHLQVLCLEECMFPQGQLP